MIQRYSIKKKNLAHNPIASNLWLELKEIPKIMLLSFFPQLGSGHKRNLYEPQVELTLENWFARGGCSRVYKHMTKFTLNLYGKLGS